MYIFLYVSTQEFLESEGIVLNDPEPMPEDPYSKRRENPQPSYTTPSEFDQTYKFLTLDRKVMKKTVLKVIFVDRNHIQSEIYQLANEKKVQYVPTFSDELQALSNLHSCRCCASLPSGKTPTPCKERPGPSPSSTSWWMTQWRSGWSTNPTVAGILSPS